MGNHKGIHKEHPYGTPKGIEMEVTLAHVELKGDSHGTRRSSIGIQTLDSGHIVNSVLPYLPPDSSFASAAVQDMILATCQCHSLLS